MKKELRAGKNLIQLLESAGYEAYYVGGCVRDALLGRSGGDVDMTTSATPEEMKQVFRDYKLIETGIKHGTVTVLEKGEPYEITTFRTEASYSDSRHPDKVDFVRNLKEDLARRDFTINALTMSADGEVIDLFGGLEDLRSGLIRAIGDPDKRFQEDALRIMRAIRFSAVLGFDIHEGTREAMLRNRDLLKDISVERIFVEFKKILMGAYGGNAIRRYIDVLKPVMPEIARLKGFNQHNHYHKYDVLEHCIRAMEYIDAKGREYMKITALLHDIGKPDTFFIGDDGEGHMYGHPARGEEIAREFLTRLKADSFTIERVCLLVKYHDLIFKDDKHLLKKWLNRFGSEVLLEILEIKVADNHGTGNMGKDLEERFENIKALIEEIIREKECFSLKDLAVSGKDLLEFMEPGPKIGKVLNELLEKVMAGEMPNERDTLLIEGRTIDGKEEG